MDFLLKLTATAATVAFFVYKVFAGSLAAATSLSLTVTPTKFDGKTWGVVAITVERGENWGAYIRRAELTVVVDGERGAPKKIDFKHYSRNSFELSPKEKTQYGAIVELPAGKPALIEALFVMQQKYCIGEEMCAESYVFGSTAVPPST